MSDVSLGLAHEAEVMLHKVGATRNNFWVPLSEEKDIAESVFRVVMEKVTTIKKYSRSIDFSTTTFEKELKKFDEVDLFNLNSCGKLWDKYNGVHKFEMAVLKFDYHFSCAEEIISSMIVLGYKPANIVELIVFFKRDLLGKIYEYVVNLGRDHKRSLSNHCLFMRSNLCSLGTFSSNISRGHLNESFLGIKI